MTRIHPNGTRDAPIYTAPEYTPGGEKDTRMAETPTIIINEVELHSVDQPAGAHVVALHIPFVYQHPDGRLAPDGKPFTGSVTVPDYGQPGVHTAPVSHPAGTDHTAIRDAAIATARTHIERFSPQVKFVHHGNPHSTPPLHLMLQGKRLIDQHHAVLEAHANRPADEEADAASSATKEEAE